MILDHLQQKKCHLNRNQGIVLQSVSLENQEAKINFRYYVKGESVLVLMALAGHGQIVVTTQY